MGNYLLEGHVSLELIEKLNLKSTTVVEIAEAGMPDDSSGGELHNHGTHTHVHN